MIEGEEAEQFKLKIREVLDKEAPNITFKNSFWRKSKPLHMTITKGELSLGLKMQGAIGRKVELTVHSLGVSRDAIAVGVSGMFSRNEIPHITIAFQTNPQDSNNIKEWKSIEQFKVTGYIREVEKPDGFGRLSQIEL